MEGEAGETRSEARVTIFREFGREGETREVRTVVLRNREGLAEAGTFSVGGGEE